MRQVYSIGMGHNNLISHQESLFCALFRTLIGENIIQVCKKVLALCKIYFTFSK